MTGTRVLEYHGVQHTKWYHLVDQIMLLSSLSMAACFELHVHFARDGAARGGFLPRRIRADPGFKSGSNYDSIGVLIPQRQRVCACSV